VDRKFLKIAWSLLPKLPMDDLDILLVDEMGKNVSGAGMDPNVIGFWRREGGGSDHAFPWKCHRHRHGGFDDPQSD
jgi:hypothetical protein